ncbi:hypothetical protein Vretifemale_13084 [Volvox reticuliferus]|uniref:Uncharacterized protein n=2 Tax=Volvox reticuliferus TaxID=1737510 RepID=A0A8J4CNI1_9CHLO|nr:hypothetical protein Vretifemale_13084 [Volvox reticuliferus]
MSRGNRGRRGSLPHPHSGGGPAAAGSLLSGPYGTGSLQPWGNTPTSVVTGVSPFSLTSEYPRSSNSAGTLQISLNSAQLRMSTGELRGVSPDGRGSAGTSPASASAATSPHNMDASVVAIATTAAAAATTTPTRLSADSGGHLSSILARVRGSMGKSRSRSKSLSRTFASTVVPLDAGSSTAARSGGSGQGSVRHDLTALPALGSGDVSGFSARLTSLFPSGSSGGGGGVIAAASRTLRGLTEKLPTLPEGGHAPLMREIRHLELRLIPLRLAARGPRVRGSNAVTATTGQGPVESAACGAPDDGSVRQRHQREQQSYSTGRGTEYMQVYRVTLLAPDVAIQPHAAVQPSPQPSSAQVPNLPPAVAQPGPSLPSPQIQPQQQPQQQPQPEPQRQPHPQPLPPARQGPSPAKQVGHTIAGPKHNPNASTAAASITNQSHAQNRSETDLELVASVPMSGTENCQDDNVSVSVGPRDVLPSGDGGASQSMTGPLLSGGGIMGEVEEASETALVNQFLSGFSDLSDQQLAGLWAAHPERSLLQDRWPANIVQLRTRLVAQAACEEAFARDNFIF